MEPGKRSQLNLSRFCQMHLSRFLVGRVPFRCARLYLTCLGKFYFLTHPQEKELIRGTIRQVFGAQLSEKALHKLFRRTFAGIMTHYQEKLFLAYAAEGKVKDYLDRRLHWRGDGELRQVLQAGRGAILVTGHYGAVEFLPGALGLRGYPAAIIVRPQTKELARSLARRAALINLNLIIPENGKVIPAALRALREGRVLITEGDEFEMWRDSESQRVNFLGFQIPADRSLQVLQKRSGAPVLTALVCRKPQGRYLIDIAPPPPIDGFQEVSRQCLKVLETAIYQSPEQWYQWKTFGKFISSRGVRRLPLPAATVLGGPVKLTSSYVPA